MPVAITLLKDYHLYFALHGSGNRLSITASASVRWSLNTVILARTYWDAAHQSDRYVDLTIAANFYVAGDEQENTFLTAYFGEGVTDYQRGAVLFDAASMPYRLRDTIV